MQLICVLLCVSFVFAVDPVSTYSTLQSGDGTYYGAVRSGGTCTLDDGAGGYPSSKKASAIPMAMNAPTFGGSLACGMCISGNGTGQGSGADPIVGPFEGFISDLCPECLPGDLDFAKVGDGRWKINWKAVNCQPTGGIQYWYQGSGDFYVKIQPRNTVVPTQKFELWNPNTNAWVNLPRSGDNFFIANNLGKLPAPIKVRLTPITNEAPIEDIVPGRTGLVTGQNNIQFVGFTSGGTTPASTTTTPSGATTKPGTTTSPAGTTTKPASSPSASHAVAIVALIVCVLGVLLL